MYNVPNPMYIVHVYIHCAMYILCYLAYHFEQICIYVNIYHSIFLHTYCILYILPKTKKFGCVGRGDLTLLLLSKVVK